MRSPGPPGRLRDGTAFRGVAAWDFDDVVVTPHTAAANRTFSRDIAALVRENLLGLDAGDALENRVV
jgi:phosphoglycerate dehydrogenase-like enzyme